MPKSLFILPFDHRTGFAQNMLGFSEELSEAENNKVKEYKHIIYSAIDNAVNLGIKKENIGVLVDEVFGLDILIDAKNRGFVTIQTVEKSGKDKLEFQYDNWQEHLLKIRPSFAKVLIRYNIQNDNQDQLNKLKELSDFLKSNNISLLIEPLMQKSKDIEQDIYDRQERYKDLIIMIKEMQDYKIDCEIWKIEGLYKKEQYEMVIKQIKSGNRADVGVVILGRNESKEHVIQWINAGKNVEGIIGFAIGRTIFWEPLINYRDGKINKEECIQKIAQEYFYYYKVFISKTWYDRVCNFYHNLF